MSDHTDAPLLGDAKSRHASRDAGVVENQAEFVVGELALDAESGCGVVIALMATVILETNVALLESLDMEIEDANKRRRGGSRSTDLELKAVDGKRVGNGGAVSPSIR